MADKYKDYTELANSENEGQGFAIRHAVRTGARVLIVGPHGGGIEPGTSEIILCVAGDDLSYYLFEGLKARRNGDLHITRSFGDRI